MSLRVLASRSFVLVSNPAIPERTCAPRFDGHAVDRSSHQHFSVRRIYRRCCALAQTPSSRLTAAQFGPMSADCPPPTPEKSRSRRRVQFTGFGLPAVWTNLSALSKTRSSSGWGLSKKLIVTKTAQHSSPTSITRRCVCLSAL
jgi:hypothetical protein